jgi:hypothetical protein
LGSPPATSLLNSRSDKGTLPAIDSFEPLPDSILEPLSVSAVERTWEDDGSDGGCVRKASVFMPLMLLLLLLLILTLFLPNTAVESS